LLKSTNLKIGPKCRAPDSICNQTEKTISLPNFHVSESASYLFSIALQQDRNTNIRTLHTAKESCIGNTWLFNICKSFPATHIHAARKPGEAPGYPWI